ncbi:MAG: YhjD/YihY/BrkB family envelope integrity protein [Phycisphaerales bacterium]|jgi:membrane protein
MSESPIETDQGSVRGLRRRYAALKHVMKIALLGMKRTQITRMAAALSYRTIFGLIPTLIISLVVLRVSMSPEDVQSNIDKVIKFTGINEVSVKAPNADAASESHRIETMIADILSKERGVNYTAIGAIGFLTLLYAAITMLVEVERSFNQICEASVGRSWIKRITHYWTFMTLGVFLLIVSFYVQEKSLALFDDALSKAATVVNAQEESIGAAIMDVVKRSGVFIATSMISSVLLLLVYSVMPNTKMRLKWAMIGAAFAGILWEAGKWGFREYVSHSTGYANLYGSIALVPLFLLWIYVTWMTVLLGLQLAHALQRYDEAVRGGLDSRAMRRLGLNETQSDVQGVRISDPGVILEVCALIVRDFNAGRESSTGHIAKATGLDESVIDRMIRALFSAGVVRKVTTQDGAGGYVPAAPPESIRAADVLAIAEGLERQDRDGVSPLSQELAKLRRREFENSTLADLKHF